MRNNHGITLIEVIASAAILGGLVMAYLQFFQLTRQSVSIITAKSDLARSLSSIENDVIADAPYIAAQQRPMAEFDDIPNHPLLQDPVDPAAAARCYDRYGGRMDSCAGWQTNNTVAYRAIFFKNWVLDRSVAGGAANPLSRLPMSLVQFRVDYKIDNRVTEEPFYFSRLYTETVQY